MSLIHDTSDISLGRWRKTQIAIRRLLKSSIAIHRWFITRLAEVGSFLAQSIAALHYTAQTTTLLPYIEQLSLHKLSRAKSMEELLSGAQAPLPLPHPLQALRKHLQSDFWMPTEPPFLGFFLGTFFKAIVVPKAFLPEAMPSTA